jgi:hypothetical protein
LELKEEQDDEEAVKAAQLAKYERQQRFIASSDDLEDYPGFRAACMASLNDKNAWRGDLDTAIVMSIRDAGVPLVDLTNDGEAGPSSMVKDAQRSPKQRRRTVVLPPVHVLVVRASIRVDASVFQIWGADGSRHTDQSVCVAR